MLDGALLLVTDRLQPPPDRRCSLTDRQARAKFSTQGTAAATMKGRPQRSFLREKTGSEWVMAVGDDCRLHPLQQSNKTDATTPAQIGGALMDTPTHA